jgi:hypothetical protein
MRIGETELSAKSDTTTERLRFNPMSAEFRVDPYSVYKRLREHAPYFRVPGALVLTRYEDVEEGLKNRDLSVAAIPNTISVTAQRLHIVDMDQVLEFVRGSIVFTDNPDHARLRRLIGQAYSPQALCGLKSIVNNETLDLLNDWKSRKTVEVVSELANRLPLNVLCAWMGVPPCDREFVSEQVHTLRYLLDPGMISQIHFEASKAALGALASYFFNHLGHFRSNDLTGAFLSLLSVAQSAGDHLSDREIVYACIMSFVAGHETTQCLIGNTLAALHLFPKQLERLRSDIKLARNAVEESIRFESPLQMTKRLAPVDVNINGQIVSAGDHVLLCIGSANRDGNRFERPDEFDIDRLSPGHTGFGYGMHACLGGAMARLQAERFLAIFVERFPRSMLVHDGQGCRTLNSLLRGWTELHLQLDASI